MTLSRTSTTWLAIVGLSVLGLASISVATSTAPLAADILPNWAIDVEAVLTQILLVTLVGVGLTLGLADRSRMAFALALGIGLAAVGWWLDMLVAGNPIAFHRLAALIGASGLLVVAGLGLDWSAFWRRPPEADGSRRRHGREPGRAWRPPR